ncbi:unnamed protein product [Closterium sp. Naga37s-1]|nr:unnamed protein product [Closterium sp. Naga37s-1]
MLTSHSCSLRTHISPHLHYQFHSHLLLLKYNSFRHVTPSFSSPSPSPLPGERKARGGQQARGRRGGRQGRAAGGRAAGQQRWSRSRLQYRPATTPHMSSLPLRPAQAKGRAAGEQQATGGPRRQLEGGQSLINGRGCSIALPPHST